MPIFEYKAYAPGGTTTTGVIDADSPREARNRLRQKKILVSEIRPMRGGRRAKGQGKRKDGERTSFLEHARKLRAQKSGPTGRDLELVAAITRQLATLLGAGIPLTEALRAMIEQAESRQIETTFRQIRERITQGTPLGDALSEHPQYFSDMYVNMVRAGEATGRVDQVLSRLADFLNRTRELQRKVVSALTYPIMMVMLGIVVVSVLMSFVIPNITKMFVSANRELPAPTEILITISDLFKDYWWVGCLVIAAVSFTIERIYKTPGGRLFIDRNLLRLPLVGDLFLKASVGRFTRTLSTLLSSGVAAVQSLEITARVVGNKVIADATDRIRVRILEGTDIATPLKATGVFPSVVGYMVSVGEKSGELEEMLDRIADAYDEEIAVVADRLTTILEPIMIMALAAIVGFIVYAIILPMLQISDF